MRRQRLIWLLAPLLCLVLLAAVLLVRRWLPGTGPATPVAQSAGDAAGPSEDLLSATVLDETPDFSGYDSGALFIEALPLDRLGRAAGAVALLDKSCMTGAARQDMAELSPTGLRNARYDFIQDRWVYNRCHLIGHRFGGATAPENLITGTHALNYQLMLPWEDALADYLWQSGGRAFFRVTPLYEGDELVCRAVKLEALSADGGRGLRFSVLCPNAQPGVAIDYATGYTTLADDWQSGGTTAAPRLYVADSRRGRFHLGDCPEAKALTAPRAERVTCHRSELLALGFKPCMDCNP